MLQRAIHDKAVEPHVTFHDLLTLSVGIALATEHHTDPDTQAVRLLRLAVEGLSPEQGTALVPEDSVSSAPASKFRDGPPTESVDHFRVVD